MIGEIDMTTIKFQFECNGTTYMEKVSDAGRSTYWVACESSESGKVHRTTKEIYETKFQEFLDEQKTLAELEEELPDDTQPVKPKKTRKPKDVAHEAEGVTLTAKQVDFIRHLPDTCFWEQGLDSCIWVDCLCDEIGGQFAGKPMTVGAMISTLCEKGLGRRMKAKVNGRTSTSFELTVKGKLIAGKLIAVHQ